MSENDPSSATADANSAWVPADPQSKPEHVQPTIVAAGMLAVVGLAVVDVATGGLMSGLPDFFAGQSSPEPVEAAAVLEGTSAPVVHSDGLVECSRCRAAADYTTLSLNEHGYFCARCGPSQPG